MKKYLGIDVSDNQGVIDWKKVKEAGVEFAVLRSVRGSGQPDKQVASNVKGCMDNKLPFGFYKYQYALTAAQSTTEAEQVIALLKTLGVKAGGDIIIWSDIEYDGLLKLGKARVTEVVNAFMAVVERAGFGFGLYAGMYDYNNLIEGEKYTVPVWLARYYKGYTALNFGFEPAEGYRPSPAQGSSSKMWGWQFTSSGRVAGINGNVDMNVCYQEIRYPEVAPEYYDTPEFTLIDSLNKIGVDSSYQNRARIAAANGIAGYAGSAEQNLKMLSLLREGSLIKA